ncbi:TIGR04283 family arsenosugar biosynthesis glycosyltransferase [Thermodesulfobacteriota bacterium]
MISSEKIVVFTRYPVPGKTKTRLIPSLGPVGSANIHRKLAENTFNNVMQFSKEHAKGIEVSYTGGRLTRMKAWLGKDTELHRQCPGDLGQRMYNDIKQSIRKGSKAVVLIGTDVPDIKHEHLEKAFYDLHDYDLVLGPSADGGYWLIGMKQPHNVFRGVSWGSEKVLDQTLDLASENNLRVSLLPPLKDIDTIDDLYEWKPDGQWENPWLSVIIPVFNEEDVIKKVLNNVNNRDSEIIVVDGGSNDRTVITARELGVKVINSDRGRAVQQNKGASTARGDALLFLHADTYLPHDYPSIIFNTLLNKQATIGAFKFKTDLQAPFMRFIELMVNFRSQYLHMPYGDQGLFMTRSFFESAGGFPQVPIAEDLFFLKKNYKRASVKIVPGYAMTSARRWQTIGLLKTTLVNIIILAGCYAGISPERLHRFYNASGNLEKS